MDFAEDANWYAIHTKPSQEDLVENQLMRINLEILNPKQKREKVVWGITKTSIVPFFPGYLFAKFSPARFLHTIQYTRGVRYVLHFGATPVRVDEELIQNIRNRIGTDGCIAAQSKPFVSGEHVSVNDGPLRGLRGIFKEEMRDGKRVLLLLEVLGVSAQVMMDKRFLRSVS